MRIIAAILGLLLALPFGTAMAQAPAAAGLSQAQVDQLVTTITQNVLQELNKQGVAPKPAPAPDAAQAAPTHPTEAMTGMGAEYGSHGSRVAENLKAIGAALPRIGSEFTRIGDQLRPANDEGYGRGALFGLILLAFVVALAVEWGIRMLCTRPRAMLMRNVAEHADIGRLAGLFVLDVVAVVGFQVTAEGLAGYWFDSSLPQSLFGVYVLKMLVAWRYAVLVLELILRPHSQPARLVPVSDIEASRSKFWLTALIFLALACIAFQRVMIAAGMHADNVRAVAVVVGIVIAGLLIVGIWVARRVVSQLMVSAHLPTEPGFAIRLAFARRWHYLAIGGTLFWLATWLNGVILKNLGPFQAMTRTLTVLLLLLIAEGIVARAARALFRKGDGTAAAVARRCIGVGLRIVAIALIAEAWAVGAMQLMPGEQWQALTRSITTAAATMFVAYVFWEIVKYWIDRKLKEAQPVLGRADEDATGDEPPPPSRLATLLPIFRVVLAAGLLVLTVLVVLTELGINTAPLIAGASVFGLAISFGSQTLVKDIVSGVFYMADDAFRVGEYIDTGKAKGTVEGFTLRSLKVRHQNGQINTIPFGQLGAITNFSRDWVTVKFNLRMSHDTDIELVRKTVKKIGQEMLTDPELGPQLLEPLKMQGVADIQDNALVLRFKFTAKPGKPSLVQRQAIRKIYQTFAEKGIKFASSAVTVQTAGEVNSTAAAGAAAAARVAAQAAAQPQQAG
ncbi:MAG: mechanosensitive ion channel family protein [Ferrovibrionaceae bacterium]